LKNVINRLSMRKFEVVITETYRRTVTISAEDKDAAHDKVEEKMASGEISLNSDDFEGYEIFVGNEIK